ncbi:MAG: phosphoribosylglycinamide formyltransferase [candidate division Zixibacteria bacterium]|nr:phosphoribosylglycinamide formyltransferase [candidate division Zixibacteria bacterium]
MLKIAVFVSGGGTNLQSLIDACSDGSVDARIEAAISNNSGAYGLKRASKVGIATYHLSSVVFADKGDYLDALIKVLADHKIDLIVLAGYMKLLPSEVVSEYYGRIINIHPALLPKYGGKGMYGMNVHRAVLKAGDRYSGATVHMVDEKYDHGSILIQRQVRVEPDDSPETLAARVLKIEHEILPRAVSLFVK